MKDITTAIVRACVLQTGSRPFVFSLEGDDRAALLPRSALGKISRAKMRTLFEAGVFADDVAQHAATMKRARGAARETVAHGGQLSKMMTATEAQLLEDLAEVFAFGPQQADLLLDDVEASFFDFGFTSMDLIRLKRLTDRRLRANVPIIVFMQNPTVRSLAAALRTLLLLPPTRTPFYNDSIHKKDGLDADNHNHQNLTPIIPRLPPTPPHSPSPRKPATNAPTATTPTTTVNTRYDPVVCLRPSGTNTPLWLVHPGVGEVFVFVGLAGHLADDNRPVYALRARGFDPGQARFASIAEAVATYTAAIRARQPRGPYAMAGYSSGAMLAFEVAKKLDAGGGDGDGGEENDDGGDDDN